MPVQNSTPTRAQLLALGAFLRFGTTARAADYLHLSAFTINRHLDHLRVLSGFRHTFQVALWVIDLGSMRVVVDPDTPSEKPVYFQGSCLVVELEEDDDFEPIGRTS